MKSRAKDRPKKTDPKDRPPKDPLPPHPVTGKPMTFEEYADWPPGYSWRASTARRSPSSRTWPLGDDLLA